MRRKEEKRERGRKGGVGEETMHGCAQKVRRN